MAGIMDLGLFKFNYSLDALRVNQIYVNHTNTGIELYRGFLDVKLDNFTLDCVANTSFNTVPSFFNGKGTGLFKLAKLSTKLRAELGLGSNNLPTVKLHESITTLSNDSLSMKFDGTNDIYLLLDKVRAYIGPMIIRIIGGTMSNETMKKVEDNINTYMGSIPSTMIIPGTDIKLDYGLITPPSIVNAFLPFALNGASVCSNPAKCIKYGGNPPTRPKKIDVTNGNWSLQVYISEFFLNSLFIAVLENSLLNVTVTPADVRKATNGSVELSTDLLGVFIPEMRQKYGPKKSVSFQVNFTSPPLFHIAAAGVSMNTTTDISVLVDATANSTVNALTVELFTLCNVNVATSKNYLKGNISDYKFTMKIKQQDVENVTIDGISRMVNTFLKIVIPQINNHLNDGVPLPSLEPYFSMSRSDMSLMEGYIHIDIDPVPCKALLEELIAREFNSFKKQWAATIPPN